MEIVRLRDDKNRLEKYAAFLEEENRNIEKETRDECNEELAKVKAERDSYKQKFEKEQKARIQAESKSLTESVRASKAEERAEKAEASYEELLATNEDLKAEAAKREEVANAMKRACVDAEEIIEVLNRRKFATNSDAMRFLNNEIDPHRPDLENNPMCEVVKDIMKITEDDYDKLNDLHGGDSSKEKKNKEKPVRLPQNKTAKKELPHKVKDFSKRRVYTASILIQMGIDPRNLPKDAKLIRRKENGYDVWVIRLIHVISAKTVVKEYRMGRYNVTGRDPMTSQYPNMLIKGIPVTPSFARFYLQSKFELNLSENRILQLLKSMQTQLPQSTLNLWMHRVMNLMRERLDPLMCEVFRQSFTSNNDETRLMVRSREGDDGSFKYKVEYIHAALSLEKKLVVMLYDEGSRSHEVQKKAFFENSNITSFTADRAAMYTAIVKELEKEKGVKILRQPCIFHLRHYFVDGYLVDHRVESILILINALFYIERMFKEEEEDQSPEARLRYRLKWSLPIMNRLTQKIEEIILSGSKYGKMVQRAAKYFWDDREAFRNFLRDGRIDISNIAIERCFRHIAMGRRNWIQSGSHKAAQNIAFMYGLYESCKLNNVDFGYYIEDILTRFKNGQEADLSFLPCNYVPQELEDVLGVDEKVVETA
jgi:hypothetical protein